jgi:Tfp pilus assembly PilM family ATPase
MVKRCIGIEIGPSYLRAVQVSRSGGQFHIEKTFNTKTRRSKDSPPKILRLLTREYGFDRRASVAISLPQDAVFFRTFETDSAGIEHIRSQDSSVFENSFPLLTEEIVPQICSYTTLANEKYSVLLTAATKDSMSERLGTLGKAKLYPDLAETIIFAVYSTALVNHPEIATGKAVTIYINESHLSLVVTQNNNVLIVRNIPLTDTPDIQLVEEQFVQLLVHEVDVTWRKAFGTGFGQDERLYLAADTISTAELTSGLEEQFSCQVTTINSCKNVKCSADCDNGPTICVPAGLALRVLAPETTIGVNFIEGYDTDINRGLNLRREFIICAVLVGSIITITLAGLFIRFSRLEAEYTHLQNEINSVFSQTLPKEKNIVNPLVQLGQKLQLLQRDYKSFGSALPDFGPLEILHTVTESIPPQSDISIENILITTESIRLTGSTQSFEHLYNWHEILQEVPEFAAVDVHNPNREHQSRTVQFTILISLASAGQK